MPETASTSSSMQASSNPIRARFLAITLALLVPLFYANDGDPFRAYEVVLVGIAFFLLSVAMTGRFRFHLAPVNLIVLLITAFMLLQPALEKGEWFYNAKFAVTFVASFFPLFALQALGPYGPDAGRRCDLVLRVVFVVIAASLVISYATGVGEVYAGGGLLQRRAFAWLGDSIAPAVVFFAFYFHFSKSRLASLVAVACLFVMQAKMAILMLLLGAVVYFLVGKRRQKVVAAVGLTMFAAVAYSSRWWIEDVLALAVNNFDYSMNNRLFSFAAGLVYFAESPVFGIGVNQSYLRLLSGFDMTQLDIFTEGAVYYEFVQIQNAFVRTAAELGIVGLALLLAFCFVILRQSFTALIWEATLPGDEQSPLVSSASLWLISFILFHQTTGWFEPGNPQLAWVIAIWALLSCVRDDPRTRFLVR